MRFALNVVCSEPFIYSSDFYCADFLMRSRASCKYDIAEFVESDEFAEPDRLGILHANAERFSRLRSRASHGALRRSNRDARAEHNG
jgi:hypothetical protein